MPADYWNRSRERLMQRRHKMRRNSKRGLLLQRCMYRPKYRLAELFPRSER